MSALARALWLAAVGFVLGSSTAIAADRHLEVVFLADGAGPMAVLQVHERGVGQQIERAGAWAFFVGDMSVSKRVSDRVRGVRRAPQLTDVPAAPAGLGLTGDVDGTLVFTLDELGDWQAPLEAAGSGAKASTPRGGPAVPSASAARLLLEPPATASNGRYTTRATLYGTRGAYTGLALVDVRADGPSGAALVLRANDEIVIEPFGPKERADARAFIADRARTCERAVPTAVLLWPEQGAPMRTSASSAPVCLPGGRALVPLSGARVEARREVPLRGILVEDGGAPRG